MIETFSTVMYYSIRDPASDGKLQVIERAAGRFCAGPPQKKRIWYNSRRTMIGLGEREQAWEHGLPEYLQHNLDAYKEGRTKGSTLLDCLWCELYGSINGAGRRELFGGAR